MVGFYQNHYGHLNSLQWGRIAEKVKVPRGMVIAFVEVLKEKSYSSRSRGAFLYHDIGSIASQIELDFNKCKEIFQGLVDEEFLTANENNKNLFHITNYKKTQNDIKNYQNDILVKESYIDLTNETPQERIKRQNRERQNRRRQKLKKDVTKCNLLKENVTNSPKNVTNYVTNSQNGHGHGHGMSRYGHGMVTESVTYNNINTINKEKEEEKEEFKNFSNQFKKKKNIMADTTTKSQVLNQREGYLNPSKSNEKKKNKYIQAKPLNKQAKGGLNGYLENSFVMHPKTGEKIEIGEDGIEIDSFLQEKQRLTKFKYELKVLELYYYGNLKKLPEENYD